MGFPMDDPMLSMLVGVLVSLASIALIALTLRVRPGWTPVSVFAGGIALSEGVSILVGVVWLDRLRPFGEAPPRATPSRPSRQGRA